LNVPTLETLHPEKIGELAGSAAPCVTVLLPPYRPGEQAKSMGAMLRTYCQDVERQLKARSIAQSEVTDFLDPLLRLTDAPEFEAGSHWGRAIFRSPEVFTILDGIESVKPSLTVAGCFQLRPVLADLHLPAEFYLLRLSQKSVELWRYAGLRAQRVELPKGVPRTLDEALAFKPPDHDLENRSSAGSSAGTMPGVRFGTGSGRERAHAYLADFFKAVDRGIRELAHGGDAPLVLAGVDEDTALYRSVASYPHLLKESIRGSANSPFSEDELLKRAYAIVRSDATERAVAGLMELKERMAPARFSTDLDTILRAAADGRVGWLYINQDARVERGDEDPLNRAAIETLRQRGLAFSLPAAKMPDGAAVAAVFRY
ncbi:MAG TPA: hypothetical protein VLW25_05915, partial [Bryobacteraceae bacterium]|nr:hypothetical protein [Bryobacteraceae bacterium]